MCYNNSNRPKSLSQCVDKAVFCFPFFYVFFFFLQHNIKYTSARVQNAKGQQHVRFHPFLFFASQLAIQPYSMLKTFFLPFLLRIYFFSFFLFSSASHRCAFATTISNHVCGIAMLSQFPWINISRVISSSFEFKKKIETHLTRRKIVDVLS